MERRQFIGAGAAALGASALLRYSPGASSPAGKPNFIFILADDLGYADVGFNGSDTYKTPQLDGLAKTCLKFTRGFALPLCGPTRAMLLTGRYPFRTGATGQESTGRLVPDQEPFIPSFLKTAGYVSSSVGKWGQLPLNAADFKFDDYFEIAGSGAYWSTQKGKGTYVVNGEDKTLAKGVYLPDLMHEHAVGFLTRNKEKPFFLYYSLSHIHGEILPTPDSVKGSKDLVADNIAYMDKLVGKLLACLDELKLRENTVLVFMGDNGSAGNRAEESTIGGHRLSGEKGSMLEGGAHVPLLISWPAKIKKPGTLDALVDISDFLPTFTDLAGVPRPANRILDGHSLAPLLLGEPWKAREWVYNQLARMWWVREDRYKLDQAGDLWDMSGAPFTETKIPHDAKDPQAMAARARLEGILTTLAPEKGKLDDGNPTGRGKNKKKK